MPHARLPLLERPGIDRCRLVAGLDFTRSGHRVRAVLLAGLGHGFDARVEIVASQVQRLPRRLARILERPRQVRAGIAALLAAELAEVGACVVGELCGARPQLERRLLAVGVTEPGAWGRSRGGLVGYLPVVDAGRLAGLTGQNVIDGFPARDLAEEGAGGPLDPLCDWLLLHDGLKTRVLVDLGRDVRLSYLPSARDPAGIDRVVSWTLSPGLSLLDRLARQAGAKRSDEGGHLAVQGQCLPEAIELWQAQGGLTALPGPRWRVAAASPKKLVQSALAAAPGAGWSVTDLLCTANHYLAREILRAIDERLPTAPPIDEVIVSGGGQQNGFLLHLLTERLKREKRFQEPFPSAETRENQGQKRFLEPFSGVRGLALVAEEALGVPSGMRGAAVAAVLALMHLDQTPACPTAITGARTPRVLGRLTPGSPQAWQRLIGELTAHRPAVVSLRSAI